MGKETDKHLAGEGPQTNGPGKMSGKKKGLIALAIVLAVALVAGLAWKSLFIKPVLSEGTEIDWGDGTRPRGHGKRKSEDWYTVLILGRDTGGGGNTDTILLASYDVTNQKATVMSIPRDTMVNVPWDIKRINSVYNANNGGDEGIEALYKEISQLVGFEPDYQVVVEWDAVGQIVDAMDGVWFDVPRNMNYEDPYQDLSIHQEKGYRLLSGDDAMQVLRYRHDSDMRYGYPDGDLGRIKTQQAFLSAMADQLLKLENFTKVNQFIDVFQRNVDTDLSMPNILWFAKAAYLGGLNMENVNFVTMPYQAATCWSNVYHNMQSYVTPDADALLELVNNDLSPFEEVFTVSDLDIMSVNADGSLSSSTGHLEDRNAGYAPVKRPAAPDEPVPPIGGDNRPAEEPIPGTVDPESPVTPEVPGTVPPADPPAPPVPEVPSEPDPVPPPAPDVPPAPDPVPVPPPADIIDPPPADVPQA